MKRLTLFFALLLLISKLTFSQQFFQKNYSIQGAVSGKDIKVYNNFIYVTGVTKYANDSSIFLSKFDLNGELVWSKSYDNSKSDNVDKIIINQNYIYLIGSKNFGTDSCKGLVIKTDMSGNNIWSKQFQSTQSAYLKDGVFINDSSIFLVGTIKSLLDTTKDVYLLKIDTAGKTLWSKSIGFEGSDFGISIEKTAPHTFFVMGNTARLDGYNEILLVKLNNDTNVIWSKLYDITDSPFLTQYGFNMIRDNGNKLVICGTSRYNISIYYQTAMPIAIKLDTNGNKIFSCAYYLNSCINGANKITVSSNGYYGLCGYVREFSFIGKIDTLGNGWWSYEYPQLTHNVKALSLAFYNNNYYITGAVYDSINYIPKDSLLSLVKTKADGTLCDYFPSMSNMATMSFGLTITDKSISNTYNNYSSLNASLSSSDLTLQKIVSCEDVATGVENLEKNKISIFPNPVLNTLQINTIENIESIEIIDILGNTKKLNNNKMIDLSEFSSGVYFIKVQIKINFSYFKIVKE